MTQAQPDSIVELLKQEIGSDEVWSIDNANRLTRLSAHFARFKRLAELSVGMKARAYLDEHILYLSAAYPWRFTRTGPLRRPNLLGRCKISGINLA